MKLWVVRHAAPVVVAGLCYGRLDVPAQEDATRTAAARLAEILPVGVEIRCSPLRRCRQFADAVQALVPELSPVPDPRLQEMDFGAWEGRTWDAIGRDAVEEWTAGFASHRPGGGECVRELMLRVGGAFDSADRSRRDVAWITHAGVVRAVRLLVRGVRDVRDASEWPDGPVPFGSCESWNLSGPP